MLHRLFMCGAGGGPSTFRDEEGWWPSVAAEEAPIIAAWLSSSDSGPVTLGGGILEVQELDAVTWMFAEMAVPFVAEWRASAPSAINLEPPPPPLAGLAVGVRVSGSELPPSTTYDNSIGRSPDVHVGYCTGRFNFNGDWSWMIPNPNESGELDNYNTLFASNNKRLHLMFGFCPWAGATGGGSVDNGAMLAAIANGDHNAKYAQFATALKNLYPNLVNRRIYIALGWEMNYSYGSWKVLDAAKQYSPTHAANWAAACRKIVDSIRNAESSIDWKFVYMPGSEAWRLSSWYPSRINATYPGDSHIDLIGATSYDGSGAGQYTAPPTDAQRTLVWNTEHQVVLNNMNSFALAHGKPQCFGEWGLWHDIGSGTLGGDDNPGYIQKVYDWVTDPAHNFEYVAYFNRNVSGFVNHSLTSYGTGSDSRALSRQKYIDTFGQLPHPY